MKNRFVVAIAVVLVALVGCNKQEAPSAQQATQENPAFDQSSSGTIQQANETPSAQPDAKPDAYYLALAQVSRDMVEYDRVCGSYGIAGSKQCWQDKTNQAVAQYIADYNAFRGMRKDLDPALYAEVEEYFSKTGRASQCAAKAKGKPRAAYACMLGSLYYLNYSLQLYERGDWSPSQTEEEIKRQTEEEFVGD